MPFCFIMSPPVVTHGNNHLHFPKANALRVLFRTQEQGRKHMADKTLFLGLRIGPTSALAFVSVLYAKVWEELKVSERQTVRVFGSVVAGRQPREPGPGLFGWGQSPGDGAQRNLA